MNKVKVKVITIHDIGNNYGSTLQACALCDFIEDSGYDVELIDYKPDYAYNRGKKATLLKWMLFPRNMYRQKKLFERYFLDHVKLTRRYTNFEELKSDDSADIYVVGSDQLWNEFYNAGRDPAYYLEFTRCTRKLAYSASLGQLHTQEELLRIQNKTKDFYAIAVRESASVRQLHGIGMNRVQHVLDPVFLQEKDYYVKADFKNKFGKYVLVYSVNNDKIMEKTAEVVAKKLRAKIVLVGGFIQNTKHDVYLRGIGPSEFTNLIYNAEFVIANSFHATALSIILNKQFGLVLPKNSPLRLLDMLEVAGIENRIVESESEISKIFEIIDYDTVNDRIDILRKKSEIFLRENLAELAQTIK